MIGRVRSINLTSQLKQQNDDGINEVSREFYRLDSRNRRVLVIGSQYERQVPTVGWLDEWPPLADYDVVIINLKSLDRTTLVKLSRVDKDRMKNMRQQLYELLMSKGEVYCILAPFMAFGSTIYDGDGHMEPEWSNLNWSPIGFTFTEVRGETVMLEGEVKFETYLRQVSGWECYLNPTASLKFIEEQLKRENKWNDDEEVFWQQIPLALNRYGKVLASSMCFGVRSLVNPGKDQKIKFISDYLHLLPPPTKIPIEQGIDMLIEEAKGMPAKTLAPDWADLYKLPGEEHLEHKINEAQRIIRAAEREQKKLFQAYRALQSTRALLFERGDNLKTAVVDVLKRMGFETKKYTIRPELLILKTRHGKMLLDIVGRSGPADSGDLQLLLKHAVFAQEDDGKIWKGILVYNHYRLNDPSQDRSSPFPAEVVTMAKEMHLRLITTEGLYASFCQIAEGSMLKQEFEDRLLQGPGIVRLPVVETKSQQPMLSFLPESLNEE